MSFEDELVEALLAGLRDCRGEIYIALSGGPDSTALLLAAHAARGRLGARALRAVHVDHGLQAQSSRFVESCVDLCARLDVPLEVLRPAVSLRAGESIEAAAREARYAALASHLGADDYLVTAHHQQDQAETFMLAALRGAGPTGLAAMPLRRRLGSGWHVRPFLQISRDHLRATTAAAGIDGIEDAMNHDARFDRAYLRDAVWPALQQRWPAAARTLARSAAHCARIQSARDEVLDARYALVRDGDALSVAQLRRLPLKEGAEVLRHFLHDNGARSPATQKLADILRQLLEAGAHRAPRIRCDPVELCRFDDRVFARALDRPTYSKRWAWRDSVCELGPGEGSLRVIAGAGQLRLGSLPAVLEVCTGAVPPGAVAENSEFGRWAAERKVRPWMRARLPRIYADAALVAVGNAWVSEPWRAKGAEACASIEWSDAPAFY